MPSAAKVPCRTQGCANLVEVGYCDRCRASGKGRDRRQTAAQRGCGYRWQRASKAYLLAHPFCADPYGLHEGLPVRATCVDHIVPHKGAYWLFWDAANWQPLCDSCHSRKTASEDGGFGRGGGGLYSTKATAHRP